MKKIIILIAILCSVIQLSGQEISFFTTYSGSDYNKFQSNYGYGFGYNHYIKSNNKLGFTFHHSFCNSNYSEIYGSLIDGISTYIKKVEPVNQRVSFKVNYAFKIVNYLKSSLYIGPEIGINYYFINEQIHRLENENLSVDDYQSQYSKNNKIGMGFLIEFELKEVISKQISISLSTHPGITSLEKCGLDGSYGPCLIGWMNFNFGIKYNLKNK